MKVKCLSGFFPSTTLLQNFGKGYLKTWDHYDIIVQYRKCIYNIIFQQTTSLSIYYAQYGTSKYFCFILRSELCNNFKNLWIIRDIQYVKVFQISKKQNNILLNVNP